MGLAEGLIRVVRVRLCDSLEAFIIVHDAVLLIRICIVVSLDLQTHHCGIGHAVKVLLSPARFVLLAPLYNRKLTPTNFHLIVHLELV